MRKESSTAFFSHCCVVQAPSGARAATRAWPLSNKSMAASMASTSAPLLCEDRESRRSQAASMAAAMSDWLMGQQLARFDGQRREDRAQKRLHIRRRVIDVGAALAADEHGRKTQGVRGFEVSRCILD